MASAGSGVVIDIDLLDQQWSSIDLLDQQWLSSLRKRVAGTGLRSRPREEPRTICRVPLHLREGDPVAYEPRIISFGPFCRDNPAVKPMEELKLRYVRRLLRRNPNAALEDYVNLIRGLEVRLRACYSEDIAMDSNKFVEMMLLDGCFFVELLLMISSGHCHGYEEEEETDPVLTTPEAGVKFREKKAESFLEVAFHDDSTMEIPKLLLYDGTNSLFRNLIAFEQCFPKAGTDVATYAVFMDCLVDSGEDVALLHRRGCLMNGLGDDEEAARLFNRLCKGVVVDYDSCYLASLFKDVKKHCDTRWYKYRARLMRDYFSNPWAFLSLLGALITIHLTVVQTSFAILAYFNPLPTS